MPTTVFADGSAAREAVAEAGLTAGIRGWQTAYRKTSPQIAYGLTGGFIPLHWLQINASLDHARRTSTPDDLRITNSETWLTLGPRFSLWIDFLRFFSEAGVAGVLRSVTYHDTDISGPLRLTAGFGAGGGFTVAIADRLGVTMRGMWRHRDDRSNIAAMLDVAWLFPPSSR